MKTLIITIGFLPQIFYGVMECEPHLTAEMASNVTIQYPYSAPTFTTTITVTPGNITVVSLPSNVSDSRIFSTANNNCVHEFSGNEDELICYMVICKPYRQITANQNLKLIGGALR